MNVNTLIWLEQQRRELDTWRRDLIIEGGEANARLEQIEQHQSWLDHQIERLSQTAPGAGL